MKELEAPYLHPFFPLDFFWGSVAPLLVGLLHITAVFSQPAAASTDI